MAKPTLVAKKGPLKGLNVAVSLWSKVLVFSLVVYAIVWKEHAGGTFSAVNSWILSAMKWYYIGLVAALLFFVVWLMMSRFGHIRLGKDDDRPEFSYFSWFAMLFGAGMGIGLVFWSIAEPIYHFGSNPFMAEEMAGTAEAAQVAMRLTFFHWGLHPWALYVFVGLTLSYFAYRKGLPLTIRSSLYPLIGDRIYGPIGHAADVMAIIGTVFGIRHRHIARLGRQADRYRVERTHRHRLLRHDQLPYSPDRGHLLDSDHFGRLRGGKRHSNPFGVQPMALDHDPCLLPSLRSHALSAQLLRTPQA